MKLISWNVNGLRACCEKGFREAFASLDADFFCLQETKLQAGQLDLAFEGYESYWSYAERKGYSGTAVFTRRSPLQVTYGLGIEEFDHEGRVITLEMPDFYLVTVYTPNSQDGLKRLDYRMAWDDAFRDYLRRLDAQKPVLACGDLNVAHREIDLKIPRPTAATPASPTRSAGSSPSCSAPASSTRSATSTRTWKASTRGGPTDSAPGKRMPAGALTTSSPRNGCATASKGRRFTRKYSARTIARSR